MTVFKALALGLAAILVWAAAAQMRVQSGRALDSNLMVGSGGYNTTRRALPVQRNIYTVNRRTGDMRYNEAAAFRSSAYSTYQRRYGGGDYRAGVTAPQFDDMLAATRTSGVAYRRGTAGRSLGGPYQLNRATGGIRYDSTAAFAQPRYSALSSARQVMSPYAAPAPGGMATPTGLGVAPIGGIPSGSTAFGTAPSTYLQPVKYQPGGR